MLHGNNDELYAVKSLLGWHINGPVKGDTRDAISCNRVLVSTSSFGSEAKGYVTVPKKVKEIITSNAIKEMFELEFSVRERGKGLSKQDRRFLENAEQGICHREDEHYEMPLPFKDNVK